RFPPYRDLGYAAAQAASADFALGSAGAGFGATTANFKGGLGSASAQTEGGVTVGALAVVNAVGSVTIGDGPWFWAAPFEIGNEFGGRGLPPSFTPDMLRARLKGGREATAVENTTLVVVVTDAILTKPQAKRLAMIAQTGMARAIHPVHAPLDGDVVFAAATGAKPVDPLFGLTELGMVAANVVARSIARGVGIGQRRRGRAVGIGDGGAARAIQRLQQRVTGLIAVAAVHMMVTMVAAAPALQRRGHLVQRHRVVAVLVELAEDVIGLRRV